MYGEVRFYEKVALNMGFEHEDIILFESLTAKETTEALVHVVCKALLKSIHIRIENSELFY